MHWFLLYFEHTKSAGLARADCEARFINRLKWPSEAVAETDTWAELSVSDGAGLWRMKLCKRYCRDASESIGRGTCECGYELVCGMADVKRGDWRERCRRNSLGDF